MLEKIEGRRKRGQQRIRWMSGITDSMDMNLSMTLWTVAHRAPLSMEFSRQEH